jgi:hypothetical protein
VADISSLSGLEIPRTVLVMGGNWDALSPPEDLTPSIESRIRVIALGVLASAGLVDTAIFTAGLTKTKWGVEIPEAASQNHYLLEQFPHLSRLRRLEEDMGHTTKMDAAYTADLTEVEGIDGPFTLLTSEAFLKRQTKIFRREGFDITPLAAEPIFAMQSPEHAAFIEKYNHSGRHMKNVVSETILRGLAVVDPDSTITEWLAARSRPNHASAG